MDTFFGPYFHFCFKLALETWAKAPLTQSLCWVHDPNHTQSLASFQWSDQRVLHLTECCLQVQNDVPTRGGEWLLSLFVPKWSSQCRPRLFYSQLRQLSCARHPMLKPTHLPLSPLFASAKPIFKTDCTNWYHAAKVRRRQMASSMFKGPTFWDAESYKSK